MYTYGHDTVSTNGGTTSGTGNGQALPSLSGATQAQLSTTTVVTHGGNIEGKITTGGSVGILSAAGEIAKAVDVGTWINTIQAGGDILGKITSTIGAIAVQSYGSILGDIGTVGGANVSALGNILSKITATNGAISEKAGGDIGGSAEAKYSVTQDSGGSNSSRVESTERFADVQMVKNYTGTIKVARSMSIVVGANAVFGEVGKIVASSFVSLGGDVEVLGNDIQSLAVSAMGNVFVMSLKDNTVSATIDKADDVYVMTYGGYRGRIKADHNVSIMSRGDVDADVIAGDGSISASAKSLRGSFIAEGNTTGNVQLQSWGGPGGTNQIVGGDISATVTATRNINIQAAGRLDGIVDAEGMVNIGAVNDIGATINGGSSMMKGTQHVIASWGSITGDLTPKDDAEVMAFGNISGMIEVKRSMANTPGSDGSAGFASNAQITAWGQVTKNINVEGALELLAAGGLGEKADVHANGAVNFKSLSNSKGTITVNKPNQSFAGRSRVGDLEDAKDKVMFASVLGNFDGTITAGGELHEVRSGANVTAVLNGTTMGSVIQNDSVLTSGDIPTIPDTGRTAILTQMAGQLPQVLADRDQFVLDRADVRADLQQGAVDASAGLAADRISQALAVADAVAQAATDHATDLSGVAGQFIVATPDIVNRRQTDAAAIATRRAALQATVQSIRDANDAAQAASALETLAALNNAAKLKHDITEDRAAKQKDAFNTAMTVRDIQENLVNQLATSLWSGARQYLDPANLPENMRNLSANALNGVKDALKHLNDTHNQLYAMGEQNGLSGWQLRYVAVGGTLADIVGLRKLEGAIVGSDPYTLEKWSKWDRLFNGVAGGVQLVSTAMGISAGMSRFMTPCSSLRWGTCFVGERLVATNWKPAPPAIVSAEETTSEGSDLSWILAGCGVVLVTTLVRKRRDDEANQLMPVHRRRPSRPEPDEGPTGPVPLHAELVATEQLDEVFARFGFEPDPVEPCPVPTIAPAVAETVTTHPSPYSRGIALKPATSPLPSSSLRPCRRWSMVSFIGLVLAVACFWQGLPALSSVWRDEVRAQGIAPAPQRELVRTKIKDLRPGRSVIAGNPELHQTLADSDIDPATWRLITLVMTKPDGGRLDIELLRPLEWIEDFGAEVGKSVDLDLAELGAAGPAEVLSIGPCPEIEPDDGHGRRVVTGTFRHSSGNVFDLLIAGEPEPIGTTGNHPFWSEDRHVFVPAETLQPGERLRKANGSTTTVVSLTRRSTTEPVYNLEVDVDHVYHVGTGGVLVHNSCWKTARSNHWKDEAAGNSGRYSVDNLKRMLEGKAPMMKVEMFHHKTGKQIVDIPMELHHRSLPQRLGTPKANEAWNLEPTTPWGHAGMDPFRRLGYDIVRIINGTNSW